jgi:hypothetical protein
MPRIRTIKPDFFTNEDVGKLSAEARLLFIGLWTLADREGRLQDRPIRIKAQLFPYDDWSVQSLLENLEQAELIWRYEADGKKCIQIINFVKHQNPHPKETGSDLPPVPGKSREITRQAVKLHDEPGKAGLSRACSHVLTMDHGSHVLTMDSGSGSNAISKNEIALSPGKTPSAARESRFSLRDCRKYAESLPWIRSPAAFAKTIWRTGEDDEAITQFLAHGSETPEERYARIGKAAAEQIARSAKRDN